MSTQVESMFIEFIPFVGISEWPGLEEFGGEKVIVNNTGFVDYAEKIDALENSDVVSHPYDDWTDAYDWDGPLSNDDYECTLYQDSQEQIEQQYPLWNYAVTDVRSTYVPSVDCISDTTGEVLLIEDLAQVQVESDTLEVGINWLGVIYTYTERPCPF